MMSWRTQSVRIVAALSLLTTAACASVAAPTAARHAVSLPPGGIPHMAAVPAHVLTADWVGFERKPPRPATDYAPYLSWDEVAPLFANAISAAGIKTLNYSNPNRQPVGGPMYSGVESTFAHDCSKNRIMSTQAPTYLMNPYDTYLQGLWQQNAAAAEAQAHFDAFEEDDSNDVYAVTALPCSYSPSTWLRHSLALIRAEQTAGYPVMYNGLSILGPGQTVSPSIALNEYAVGGMMEGCYIRPGTTNYQPSGLVWRTIENTELAMAADQKLFFCYADNWQFADDSATALTLRQYAYASFLLTYDPGTSVLWETFLTNSHFRVNPETGFVATSPVVPPPSTIDGLATSTGVYGRQYQACFVRGTLVGACAAVVNPDAFHSHAFPYTGYSHTLVIAGSGIFDGGTVATNGGPPPSTMAPLAAYVALP